jgi:hypothetical protein
MPGETVRPKPKLENATVGKREGICALPVPVWRESRAADCRCRQKARHIVGGQTR